MPIAVAVFAAVIAVAAYILLNLYIDNQRGAAAILNMAGRQRMLSQQIALEVSELRAGDSSARNRLIESVDLMEKSHLLLSAGHPDHPLSETLRDYFFKGPNSLDQQVRSFVAMARRSAESDSVGDERTDFSSLAMLPLLTTLDRAVTMLQAESDARLESLLRVEWLLRGGGLIAGLFILVAFTRSNARLRRLAGIFLADKQAQEADAHYNFAALLEAVPDATFVMKPGGWILLASAEAERLFGYSRTDLIGQNIETLMPSHSVEIYHKLREGFRERLDQGPFTIEQSMVGKGRDNRQFPLEVRLSPLKTRDGLLVLASVRDVSEREREAEDQRARDEYLRLATERSGVGVWHWRIHDDQFQWSDAFRNIFGVDPSLTPSNAAFRALIHPEDIDRVTAEVSEAISEHRHYAMEYRIIRPDGAVRIIAARGSALYDQRDSAVRMTGLVQDITSRKRNEEALRESEERFRRIFDEGPMGIALVGKDSRFVSVNEALCRMVGYTAEELYRLTFKDITHPDDLDVDVALAEQVFRGDIDFYQIEKRYFVRAGGTIWINLTVTVLRDMGGDISYALAMIENITHRKQLEKELEEQRLSMIGAARLSAIGTMAGGIAHEINNPVAIISASAENIQDMIDEESVDIEDINLNIKRIIETCERVGKIVNSMRLISREADADPMVEASIKEMVENTLALCSEKYKIHSVKLEVNEVNPSLMIRCREVQICQVLLNLLQNAFDAVLGSYPDAWVRLDVVEGERAVSFDVVDSGPGIDDNLKNKIMEPFFTTKPVGQGTGLGLSLSNTIAQQHGGTLTVGDRDGRTCFTLSLPRNGKGEEGCH